MPLLSDPRLARACRVLFFAALVGAVTMALLPQPPQLPIDRYGDKFAHIVAFAVLAALAALGFPRERLWPIAERLSFVGALIEVAQSIPALNRDCDVRDWIADTLSVVIVIGVARLVPVRHRHGQP